MPKISKYKLTREIDDLIWERMLRAFRNTKNNVEVNFILDDLLTPTEKIMLSKRLAVAFFLERGLSYSQIMKILKVSSSTINAIKNSNRRSGRGLKQIVEGVKVSDSNKLDKILNKIFEGAEIQLTHMNRMLSNVPRKTGGNRWKFLK